MLVIILNGPARSGKGELVKYLKDFGYDVTEYSSIQWAKDTARKCFGWDGEKTPQARNMLAEIKQIGIKYADIPFRDVVNKLDEAIIFKSDIFTTDIREPEEISKMVSHCKNNSIACITVRVSNKKAEREAIEAGLSLTGDGQYADYDYTVVIPNNGTMEQFHEKIEEYLLVPLCVLYTAIERKKVDEK